MFRPLPLWRLIPCPALEARGICTVTHCLFSHIPQSAPVLASPTLSVLVPPTPATISADPPPALKTLNSAGTSGEGPSGDPRLRKIVESNFGTGGNDEGGRKKKRRKLSDDEGSAPSGSVGKGGISLTSSPAPANKRTKTKVETGSVAAGPRSILKKSVPSTQKVPPSTSKAILSSRTVVGGVAKASLSLPSRMLISEPSTPIASPETSAAAPTKPLTLNPRLVPISPASHSIRLQLLTLLHKEYVRLHEGNGDPQDMLRLALDEEEKVAKEMRSIYTQAMKRRIVRFQKTSVAAYQSEQEEKKKQIAREEEDKRRTMTVHGVVMDNGMVNSKAPLVTGLSPAEELIALRSLLQRWEVLGKYGYILEPPTMEEIRVAEKGMEAAGGWESCERCNSRFQVFDGRRESDGQLASGGKCVFHWGKAVWPPSKCCFLSVPLSECGLIIRNLETNSAFALSDSDKVFTCCRQKVGQSSGCVTCENHVYKVSEAKRLAAIWQFVETPGPQKSIAEDEAERSIERAICLDCEMCFTTLGTELIRVTATAFPSGEVVVDALVRPKGGILDLNSRFSGVFPKHIMNAQPYSERPYPPTPTSSDSLINPSSATPDDAEEEEEDALAILPSPEAARSLLLSYIDSETPILGHGLENDLNALRLCHRTIVDTIILFPHQRGLPLRNKLKWLVEKHLGRMIQVEGDSPQGHDSKIDARCAGELVRSIIKEETAKKKRFESDATNGVAKKKLLKRNARDCD